MIREEKQILRRRMRETLAAFPDCAAASEKIRRQLIALAPWREAAVVYGFLPLVSEPDWLGEGFAGKTLAFPCIDSDTMEFRVGPEFVRGPLGIRQPSGGTPAPPPDLLLVPGLAFDASGRRLGRGRGHYDRWLAGRGGATAIGICFACQITENIPSEDHDVPMNAVLTEDGLLLAKSSS